MEVVPHAGLVERKPLQREHQLGSKWRMQFTRPDPRSPQNHLCTHYTLSMISWSPPGSTGVKVFPDRLSPREGRRVPSHKAGATPECDPVSLFLWLPNKGPQVPTSLGACGYQIKVPGYPPAWGLEDPLGLKHAKNFLGDPGASSSLIRVSVSPSATLNVAQMVYTDP